MITIPDFLPATLVSEIRGILATANWQDGSPTGPASGGKRNFQAQIPGIDQEIARLVAWHPVVETFAFPAEVSTPMFTRYDVGMLYAPHFDNPVMHGLRTDLSMTIFLSDGSDDFSGGHLVVGGVAAPEPRPGTAVIYPTSSIHEVTPVTRGSRLACVLWIQSHVRDAGKRALLRELRELELAEAPSRLRLGQLRANLLRRWAD
jgi:PKHD-type hydroxylase